MRLKITSLLAAAALVSACGSSTDECLDAAGQGASESYAPGSVAEFVASVGDRVFFDYDKSAIRSEGIETIARQADWLKKYSNYRITIQGHCDKRGTVEYNLALGERRANAAKKQLLAHGIEASRVNVVSYGKNNPVAGALGDTESDLQNNRTAIAVLGQ